MPERGLVTLSAYAVVFGTLVLQGATLGPLIRWLGIGDDGAVKGEVADLRRELVHRALAAIEGRGDDAATSMRIRLLQIASETASSRRWLGRPSAAETARSDELPV